MTTYNQVQRDMMKDIIVRKLGGNLIGDKLMMADIHAVTMALIQAGFRTTPPAPVSVADERYQNLSELYHAQEKRLFKLAQRIKGPSFDKYSHSPSQAIDVLESALFGESDDTCRAALLQGSQPVSNRDELLPSIKPAPELDSVAINAKSLPSNPPSKCSLRDGIEAIRNSGIPVDVDKIQSECEAGNSLVIPDCWCRTCRPVMMGDMRFVVCPECGNKRCPHANDHNNACTGSNEPGQAGSAYPAAPQQEVK